MAQQERVLVLVPAAGLGRRMGGQVRKPYLQLQGLPVLVRTLRRFQCHPLVDEILVLVAADQVAHCRRDIVEAYGLTKVRTVLAGGAERQESVHLGLEALTAADEDIVVIHDGVRPLFAAEQLETLLAVARRDGACLLGVPVTDTIKEVADGRSVATPPRARLWAAQTPQLFRYGRILAAHRQAAQRGYQATDDAALLEWLGQPVTLVAGAAGNLKLTRPEDLVLADFLLRNADHSAQAAGEEEIEVTPFRIGQGYDVHRLVPGRPLVLGGLTIPHEVGLLGHSDADVLLHALCDALLGAIGAGDLGRHFPDTDPAYKGIASSELLRQVLQLVARRGYRVGNIDATIVAQRPRLAGYIPQMVAQLAACCAIMPEQVNIKATTTETLGFEGRQEGISAQAVVLLISHNGTPSS